MCSTEPVTDAQAMLVLARLLDLPTYSWRHGTCVDCGATMETVAWCDGHVSGITGYHLGEYWARADTPVLGLP